MITLKPDENPSLDLEGLGAYLEGKLEKEEHARVEDILARDPRAREVYAETLRNLEEFAVGDHSPEVAQFPASRDRRTSHTLGFAVGLLAAAALLCWLIIRPQAPDPPMDSPSMLQISELLPSPPPGMTPQEYFGEKWQKLPWSGTRTAEATDDIRLGAWLVILRAALDGNDAATAQRATRRIAQAIVDRNTTSAREYRGLATVLEATAFPRELLVEAEAAEHRLLKAADSGRFDRTAIDFGRWAAAGRFAALAETLDPKIFARVLRDGDFSDRLDAEQVQRFERLFTEMPTNHAALVMAFTELLAAAA